MKQKSILLILFLITWTAPIFSLQESLKLGDISKVMERLLHLHIESKELTSTTIRRSIKLYIEQFDLEKAYLLESEVAPYLNMELSQVEAILSRLQQRNFSDFIELNEILERSVYRAQNLRTEITKQLI